MRPESELFAKFEQWLAARPEPPTLFDVMATGDGELFAALVLKGFRAAARQAVVERLEREAATIDRFEATAATAGVVRVFDGISQAWALQDGEKVALLGLRDGGDLRTLWAAAPQELPTEILERVIILVDIFKAINILLPQPSRADAWIRRPNRARPFAGQSALEVMVAGGLEGLRQVRAYLQAQIWST